MTKTHHLDHCLLKIDRANEHIKNIDPEVTKHFSAYSSQTRQEYDVDKGELVILLKSTVAAFSPHVSMIIGEAVHQLRSALDHLVWQLIVAKGKTPPPKSGFPIFRSTQEFKSRAHNMIKGVSSSAEARIKSFQPYHRGVAFNRDALWVLHELNNTDKHRLLNATAFLLAKKKEIHFHEQPGPPGKVTLTFRHNIPVKDGAEILRIRTEKREVKMNLQLGVAVAFQEVGGAYNEPAIPLLAQLSGTVRHIIQEFMVEF